MNEVAESQSTAPTETALDVLSRFLGVPIERVTDVFVELDGARRVAALIGPDGRAGFEFSAAATLLLTTLLDPPPGRAIEYADALGSTRCRRLADMTKPIWPAPENQTDGECIGEIFALMMSAPTDAKALNIGIDGGTVRAVIRYEIPNEPPMLAMFSGPPMKSEPEGSGVVSRMTAIDCQYLADLARRMACIPLQPTSNIAN